MVSELHFIRFSTFVFHLISETQHYLIWCHFRNLGFFSAPSKPKAHSTALPTTTENAHYPSIKKDGYTSRIEAVSKALLRKDEYNIYSGKTKIFISGLPGLTWRYLS
jgi:hypothetical protein